MDVWWAFYEKLFNFREIRYFDIEGKLTGLKSRALTSPCGQIRIPINESSDDRSQIEEYLRAYNGEGIQHIALGTTDIFASVEGMRGPASPSWIRRRPTTSCCRRGCPTSTPRRSTGCGATAS
ncbi:VOC family protein [Paeniroseomonas aquatica]